MKYSPPKRKSSFIFAGDAIKVEDDRADGGSDVISMTLRNCSCCSNYQLLFDFIEIFMYAESSRDIRSRYERATYLFSILG